MDMPPLSSMQIGDEAYRELGGQLRELISVGVAGDMLTALIDVTRSARGFPPLQRSDRRFVGGPVIVHSRRTMLDGDHPVHKFKQEILFERAQAAMMLSPFPVGPAELMTVMFELNLEHPLEYLRPGTIDVFLWASSKAMSRYSGVVTVEDFWRQLNHGRGEEPIAGRAVYTTDDMILTEEPYRSTYLLLADQVRRKVVAWMDQFRKVSPRAAVPDIATTTYTIPPA